MGLSSSSSSNASLGLEGPDGDLNGDSIGVTGSFHPALFPECVAKGSRLTLGVWG